MRPGRRRASRRRRARRSKPANPGTSEGPRHGAMDAADRADRADRVVHRHARVRVRRRPVRRAPRSRPRRQTKRDHRPGRPRGRHARRRRHRRVAPRTGAASSLAVVVARTRTRAGVHRRGDRRRPESARAPRSAAAETETQSAARPHPTRRHHRAPAPRPRRPVPSQRIAGRSPRRERPRRIGGMIAIVERGVDPVHGDAVRTRVQRRRLARHERGGDEPRRQPQNLRRRVPARVRREPGTRRRRREPAAGAAGRVGGGVRQDAAARVRARRSNGRHSTGDDVLKDQRVPPALKVLAVHANLYVNETRAVRRGGRNAREPPVV
mmetsp:Transcript_12265/g.51584  ORF Transcript_12265/g.51584 Transcript_12265/m.51584 type:complete len:324 (-) Transcript_12265:322-1293(-)